MPDGIFRVINASHTPLPDPKRLSAFGLPSPIRISSFPQRQLDTHRRAFPRFALPSHLGADFPRSFADADAAEVTGLAVGLGGGVEAVAVVGDPESEE